MEPSLQAGDRLLVVRRLRPRSGDVVAVRDPRQPQRTLLKRVSAVDGGTGRITVVGDNPAESTDSRVFGAVDRELYVGRAVYRYHPRARVGRLRS
ncbi:MAG: hypothetical protein QOG03_1359 [Actinomycetota bacterium]|nr:hypothetical protein [Actinomycetota bacterium]